MADINDPSRNPRPGSSVMWTVLAVCVAIVIAGLIYVSSGTNQTTSTIPGTTTGQSTNSGSKANGQLAPGPPQQPPR